MFSYLKILRSVFLRYDLHIVNVTLLNYSFMSFNKCLQLCNNHHNKKILTVLSHQIYSLPFFLLNAPPYDNHLFLHYNFVFSRFYTNTNGIFSVYWILLLSLSIMHLIFIHAIVSLVLFSLSTRLSFNYMATSLVYQVNKHMDSFKSRRCKLP